VAYDRLNSVNANRHEVHGCFDFSHMLQKVDRKVEAMQCRLWFLFDNDSTARKLTQWWQFFQWKCFLANM